MKQELNEIEKRKTELANLENQEKTLLEEITLLNEELNNAKESNDDYYQENRRRFILETLQNKHKGVVSHIKKA